MLNKTNNCNEFQREQNIAKRELTKKCEGRAQLHNFYLGYRSEFLPIFFLTKQIL